MIYPTPLGGHYLHLDRVFTFEFSKLILCGGIKYRSFTYQATNRQSLCAGVGTRKEKAYESVNLIRHNDV